VTLDYYTKGDRPGELPAIKEPECHEIKVSKGLPSGVMIAEDARHECCGLASFSSLPRN